MGKSRRYGMEQQIFVSNFNLLKGKSQRSSFRSLWRHLWPKKAMSCYTHKGREESLLAPPDPGGKVATATQNITANPRAFISGPWARQHCATKLDSDLTGIHLNRNPWRSLRLQLQYTSIWFKQYFLPGLVRDMAKIPDLLGIKVDTWKTGISIRANKLLQGHAKVAPPNWTWRQQNARK